MPTCRAGGSRMGMPRNLRRLAVHSGAVGKLASSSSASRQTAGSSLGGQRRSFNPQRTRRSASSDAGCFVGSPWRFRGATHGRTPRVTCAQRSARGSTARCPARPMLAQGGPRRRNAASAMACVSGGTTYPVTPSSTTSRLRPRRSRRRQAHHRASCTTVGAPSNGARRKDRRPYGRAGLTSPVRP
jgi:hypothetical protein